MSPPYAGKEISSTKRKILSLARGSVRWRDLKKNTMLPDSALYRHLKELQEIGWIKKTNDGRYILTNEGRDILEETEIYELVEEIIKKIGAKKTKEYIQRILERKIENVLTKADIVETIVHLLRAWSRATWAYNDINKLVRGSKDEEFDIFDEKATYSLSSEEKKVIGHLFNILEEIGGKKWYKKYDYLLTKTEKFGFLDYERNELYENIEKYDPFLHRMVVEKLSFKEKEIFRDEIKKIKKYLEECDKELQEISQEKIDLLNTSLRKDILKLLEIIEEKKNNTLKILKEFHRISKM